MQVISLYQLELKHWSTSTKQLLKMLFSEICNSDTEIYETEARSPLSPSLHAYLNLVLRHRLSALDTFPCSFTLYQYHHVKSRINVSSDCRLCFKATIHHLCNILRPPFQLSLSFIHVSRQSTCFSGFCSTVIQLCSIQLFTP